GSGNTLTQPAGPTGVDGTVTGTLRSTVAEARSEERRVGGVGGSQTATVTVTRGPVSAAQSTVSAAPPTIEAGTGSSTITVTARDANGNPIAGATVQLQATGSGNTLTQPTGPTGPDGTVTGTLRSTAAEAKTISATINGLAVTQTAPATVTSSGVSAAQSTVAAAPPTIEAGSGISTITVTARDANGNLITGATVALQATGSGNTLTQPTGPTDASGVATGTLRSTAAEAKTISATINGLAVTQKAASTHTSSAVTTAQSTVAAAPPT